MLHMADWLLKPISNTLEVNYLHHSEFILLIQAALDLMLVRLEQMKIRRFFIIGLTPDLTSV